MLYKKELKNKILFVLGINDNIAEYFYEYPDKSISDNYKAEVKNNCFDTKDGKINISDLEIFKDDTVNDMSVFSILKEALCED